METGTPGIALDADGKIAQDVTCIRCGYNLRGLPQDRQCPECGTAIGRSLHGDFLRFRDPDWVESLASGMNWIVAGIVCSVVFGCVAGATVRGGGFGLSGAQAPLTLLVSMATGLVSFIGYWKVTSPDPASPETEDRWTSRQIARFGVVFRFVGTPTVGLVGNLLAGIPASAVVLGICSWIISTIGQFAFMTYARRIALRVPDEKLARHTRIVMWGLVIPLINIIFVIWSLVLILRYRNVLQEAARQARATWATTVEPMA